MLHQKRFANRIEINDTQIKHASMCDDVDNSFTFVFAYDLDGQVVAKPFNPNKDSAEDYKAGFWVLNCEGRVTNCWSW